MGNIAFNSFNKNMSDEDFLNALMGIVKDRFGDKAFVETHKGNDGSIATWVVSPSELACPKEEAWRHEIEFIRESKRKFGTKHPHSEWGGWFMVVVQNELAVRFNGRISDEGVSGTWKGDTSKYPTFRSWVETIYPFLKENHLESFEQIYRLTPEPLRNV